MGLKFGSAHCLRLSQTPRQQDPSEAEMFKLTRYGEYSSQYQALSSSMNNDNHVFVLFLRR